MSSSIDPRIQLLSYSSLLTLHSCPRKFQLSRISEVPEDDDFELTDLQQASALSASVTFAYGHVVGEGIQNVLEGKTEEEILWAAFLQWDADLLSENTKQNKSFWGALYAIQAFASMRQNGFLEDYELVYYHDKPACELSFSIAMPDGFIYRGFVDAVLKSKSTGKVLVLECKTTGSSAVNPATYKNSAQAIGYSIVLDALFPDLSSYEVLYLVYQTKAQEYVTLEFPKTYYQRALWIQELLLDIETIKMYENAEVYPMRGESCFTFFRECEFYGACTLSTERLKVEFTEAMAEKRQKELDEFQIKITLQDLISAQVRKTEDTSEF